MGDAVPGDREPETTTIPQPRRPSRVPGSGPNTLELPPWLFTNRTNEFDKLRLLLENADDGRPAIHLISGQAGVGKTALARTWAYRVADRFPDGQLEIDLGGFSSTGRLSAEEALSQCLTDLGVKPESLPASVRALAAKFRDLTARKSLLILLDNAATFDQVQPLLPTSPLCLVLVTSRRRMGPLQTRHGAGLVELKPLTTEHSTELLTKAVGASRVAAEAGQAGEIVKLCGGLPIALTVVSGKLASIETKTLATTVTELKRNPLAASVEGEDSVNDVVDWSYEELSPAERTLYGALSLHPGAEFGTGVAAAAIGETVETTQPLLDQLVIDRLLDGLGDERYKFHDLIRAHAKSKTEPRDHETYVRRMLEWYLHAATKAGETGLTTPDQDAIKYQYTHRPVTQVSFSSREAALDWLELERANLVAAVELADDFQLYALGWQLAAAMWPLFLLRKHYPSYLRVSQLGVRHAQRWQNSSAEALMHNRSGAATRAIGEYDKAVEHYRSGHQVATAGKDADPVIAIRSVEGLGLVALQQGRLDDALEFFREDLALSSRLDRPHDIGLAQINLGSTLTKAGQYAEAIDTLREARNLLDGQGDAYNTARARIEFGRALAMDGRPDEARSELALAQETMNASGSKFEQARTLQALGEVAESEGDVETARRLYDQALPIFVGLGRPEASALQERINGL